MNHSDTKNNVYDTTVRLLILLLVVGWCFMIMLPFISIIMWSLILGTALKPLHTSLAKRIGNRPKWASAIIISAMLLVIIVPIAFMVAGLVDEVKILREMYAEGKLTIPPPNESVESWPLIGEKLYAAWASASESLEQTVVKYQEQLSAFGKSLGKGLLGSVSAMVQFVISFVIAGIVLVYSGTGERIRWFFRKIAGERGDEFADVTVKTVASVVKGVLGVALVLALLHGIIFLLAGVPFAGIWTLLVFVLCVLQLPVIFVTLPIIIYLFSVNDVTMGIVWTVLLLIAGLSDNVLKPILLGKGAPVPMLVIFIGVIGGFIFSGFIGLFTGAIIMSIGYKLFITWITPPEYTPEEVS